MFLKRLSTALCAIMCFSGIVVGTNPGTLPNDSQVGKESTLLAPLIFTPTVVNHNPRCYSNNDGYFNISINDPGNPLNMGYNYQIWDSSNNLADSGTRNGSSFTTNGVLGEGTYRIRITEISTGNIAPDQNKSLVAPNQIVLTGIANSPVCSFGDGEIILNASGGVGGFEYYLDYGTPSQMSSSTDTFTVTESKNYFGYVVDNNNCTATTTEDLIIKILEEIDPIVTIDPIECESDRAKIILNGLPFNAISYQIRLDGIVQSPTISGSKATLLNVTAGNHELEVIRPNCSADNWPSPGTKYPIEIKEYKAIDFVWDHDPNSVSVDCYGEDTTLTVTVTGAMSGRTCTFSLKNNDTGIIELKLNNQQFNQAITLPGLKANTSYTVLASDLGVDCSSSKTYDFNIDGPVSQFIINSLTKTNVSCNGASDGTVKINFSNAGTSSVFYSIDNGVTFSATALPANNTIAGLSKGSYNVILKNNNGCESNTMLVKINEPNTIATLITNTTPLSCVDGTDGTIQVLTTGGTKPYFYTLLRNGSATAYANVQGDSVKVFTNLIAGDYEVKVNDNVCTGVVASANTSIDGYTAISFSYNPDTVKCNNETTNLFVQAGNGVPNKPFTYQLYDLNNNYISEITETNYSDGVTFTSVLPGSYNVRLVYDGACSFVTKAVSIYNPRKLIVTAIDSLQVDCSGDQVSTNITITGEGPFRYSTDGLSYQTFGSATSGTLPLNLAGGLHQYYFMDRLGCEYRSGVPLTIVVEEPDPIQVDLTVIRQLTCPGGSTGSLMAVTTGGREPYYYTLKDGAGNIVTGYNNKQASDTLTFIGLPANKYTVEVVGTNCADIAPIVNVKIDSIPAIAIDVVYDPALCNNELIENFAVTANGGIGTKFTYSLTDNLGNVHPNSPQTETSYSAGVNFTNLLPGRTYTIVASYGTCNATKDVNIINPTKLAVTYPSTVELSCYGDSTNITIKASGKSVYEISTDGITYQPFSNGAETVLSDLKEGIYSYYIKGDDCVYNNGKAISIEITAPDEIAINNLVITNETCKSKNNGKVTFTISGGIPGYQAKLGSLSQPSTTGNVSFNNVSAGDYTLQITDNKGCILIYDELVKVGEPAEDFVISSVVITDSILCFGEMAEVIVNTTGGHPTSSNSIHIVGQGLDLTGVPGSTFTLKGGEYTITASNDDGCTYALNYTVPSPKLLVLKIDSYKNVSCAGNDDAEITISATGGTLPYFYGVNVGVGSANEPFMNGANTTISGGLENETYNIIVRDVNNCQSNIVTQVITEPDPITFEFVQDSFVTCAGAANGVITVINAKGGPTVNYSAWLTTNGVEAKVAYPAIENLSADTYQLRITDANGLCSSSTVDITIGDPTPIVFIKNDFVVEHVKCYNINIGKIIVAAEGGVPYKLEYRIKSDGTGYDSGYRSSNIFENLAPGFYDVWVRNNRGNCEIQYSTLFGGEKIRINAVEKLIVDSIQANQFKCHNDPARGSVQIIASGGTSPLTYWLPDAPIAQNSNGTGFFDNIGELNQDVTTYQCYVTDDNQCQSETYTFNIINPKLVQISLIEKVDARCHNSIDGTIRVSAIGGTVPSGSYKFVDLFNASYTYQVEKITTNEYLLKGLGNTDPNGAEYQPQVADDNGCTANLTPQVLIKNPQEVNFELEVNEANCFGDTDDAIIFHAIGGTNRFKYSLDAGTTLSEFTDSIFINPPVGIKKPYVVDEHGCLDPVPPIEFLFEEPEPLNVAVDVQGIRCYEDEFGNVILNISGGTGNYYLSVNSNKFLPTGVYANPYEILQASTDTTTFDMLDNGINLAENTTYQFFLKDENNCHVQNVEGISSIEIPFADAIFTRPEKLELTSLDPLPVTCRNEQTGRISFVAIGGNTPYILTAVKEDNPHKGFTKKNVNGTLVVKDLFAGIYQCSLTDENGCEATYMNSMGFEYDKVEILAEFDSIRLVIDEVTEPTCDRKLNGALSIDVSQFMYEGAFAQLYKMNRAIGKWNLHDSDSIYVEDGIINNDTIPTYDIYGVQLGFHMGIGDYKIRVTDNYSGCRDSMEFELSSENGTNCPPVNYFNIFTPQNGDSDNNEWLLINSDFEHYILQIYSAYGELIYNKEGISDEEGIKWDGLDNKQRPVPVGTYIYLLKKFDGVNDTIINGNVSVIRSDGW